MLKNLSTCRTGAAACSTNPALLQTDHYFQREPGRPVAAGRAVTAPDVVVGLLAYMPPCLLVLVPKLGMWEISDARLLVAIPDTREVCGTLSRTSFTL